MKSGIVMKMKILPVACLLAMVGLPAIAAQFDERAVINQRIGGGRPLEAPTANNPFSKAAAGWDVDLTCSEMSLSSEILGSFNSGSFKQLHTTLAGNLMAALNPTSLIGMALQRANPDLYDSMMSGSLSATDAFNMNAMSCQEMQQGILDKMPAGALNKLAISEEYSEAIKKHANSNYQLKDLVFKDGAAGRSYDDGKKGVQFGTEKRGMVGKPIKVTEHASFAGFNALAGRRATDSSPLSPSAAQSMGMGAVFKSPKEANTFISDVVGETRMYTDKDASPREEDRGIGAKAAYAKEFEAKNKQLLELANKPVSSITAKELESASTSSIKVTQDLLLAIKQIHPKEQGAYVSALATDLAIANTYDKLLHSVRIMDAGIRDESVTNNEAVRTEAMHKRALLVQEMDLLEREIRFKKDLAGSSAIDILRRANMENKAGSFRTPTEEVPVGTAN